MRVLAVIPCHNEELSIQQTIQDIKDVVSNVHIWVIDNASTDKTAEKSREVGAIVYSCPRKGKGYAVRHAFSQIRHGDFDAIFMVDGDHTYGVQQLPVAIQHIVKKGFDMVVGVRIEQSNIQNGRTRSYRLGHSYGNKVLTALYKFLFRIEIKDTLSGWRCFSPGFVNSFSGGASGFELETELNAHVFTIQGSVENVDVEYFGRVHGSESKLRTFKDGLKILRRLVYLWRNERPIWAYGLVSVPWIAASVFLLWNVIRSYLVLGEIPNFPSLIAAIGFLVISVLLWATGILVNHQRIIRSIITRNMYRR